MRIALIAAMSKNGVIGNQNALPWNLPEDLKYFKKMTLGKPVIMGRKTFESMNSKPLPRRRNLILTKNAEFSAIGCEIVHSVEAVMACVSHDEEVMVIGGSQVYEVFLPLASRLYLSYIHKEYLGDTYFPKVDFGQWKLISEEDRGEFSTKIFDRKVS